MPPDPFLCQFIDSVKKVSDGESTDIKQFLTEKLKVHLSDENHSRKKVLILTRKHDAEADFVGIELVKRRIEYVRINTDDIPGRLFVTYMVPRNSNVKAEVAIEKEKIDMSKVSVVWLRNFETQAIKFGNNNMLARLFSFEQWDDALQILKSRLNCEWISEPHATQRANSNRIEQLSIAKSLGFDIPATLVTNDPKAAHDFYRSCHSNVILKALHHHSVEVGNKIYSMYTHKVSKRDLKKLDDLTLAPCILQQRLNKKHELRVTVVGKKVFAVKIDSQRNTDSRDDWHRHPLSNLHKRDVELSPELSRRCIKIVRSLGLVYGSIDFVVDKKGRLVFLEVNPTGDWHWLGNKTAPKITEAIADLIEQLM